MKAISVRSPRAGMSRTSCGPWPAHPAVTGWNPLPLAQGHPVSVVPVAGAKPSGSSQACAISPMDRIPSLPCVTDFFPSCDAPSVRGIFPRDGRAATWHVMRDAFTAPPANVTIPSSEVYRVFWRATCRPTWRTPRATSASPGACGTRSTTSATAGNSCVGCSPCRPTAFADRLVLDMGCGKGRHLRGGIPVRAREVIGVDLSEAVDVAFAEHTRPRLRARGSGRHLPHAGVGLRHGLFHRCPPPHPRSSQGFRGVLPISVRPRGHGRLTGSTAARKRLDRQRRGSGSHRSYQPPAVVGGARLVLRPDLGPVCRHRDRRPARKQAGYQAVRFRLHDLFARPWLFRHTKHCLRPFDRPPLRPTCHVPK